MPKPKKIETNQDVKPCFHCGEPCLEDVLWHDEKDFCCTGCKLVYEVLNENGLCTYYDIAAQPGSSQKSSIEDRDNRFDYLIDQDVILNLVDFQNDEETHVSFHIPFIHCASCIWLLENLQKINSGIISGRVDFLRKKVQFKFHQDQISLKNLVLLLAHIGYEPRINLSDVDNKPIHKSDRKLIFKIAVAGFCFGNMMFFSLPEYFSEAELLGEGFKGMFDYLNILLALPIFFYAATDYYRSAWLSIRNYKINMDVPIVIGIFTLFFYSLYEILIVGNAGYMDTLGGLLFYLLIGKLYQQKTFDTLSFDRDYKSYFPVAVTRMVREMEEVVTLSKLKVGDIIKVRNGELIPSDSILIDGEAHIDYSFVTGEEVPVSRNKGELIFAGGRQTGAAIILAVQKSPSQSYLTDLWNNESFAKEQTHGLSTLATQISGKFTLTVLGIAFSALLFWSFVDISVGIKSFTAVLIITCPCALAMTTPFTLGNTLRIFGQGKFYLKNAQVLEKMAQIDTVIFDKTGTLTAPSEASINYIHLSEQKGLSQANVLGLENLTPESQSVIKAMVGISTHPLSNRINAWLNGVEGISLKLVEEISGRGIKAFYKSQEFKLGSAEYLGVSYKALREEGNQVFFMVEGHVLGYFLIQSGLRKDIEKVVNEIQKSNEVHFLSGDQDHELVHLKQVFGDSIRMNFNQGPIDKLDYIQTLNSMNYKTLMIGDGLNDAGALKESQLGIALTDQISNFTPSSDAIMDASVLHNLPAYLEFSKTSRKIIKASFGLSFTYNLAGIFFAVQGLVSPVFCAVLMPASSISVVVFTTLATNYLAFKNGLKSKII